MPRVVLLLVAALAAGLLFADRSHAAGGSYAIDGGTPAHQRQVVRALEASAFPWDLVPGTVAIHLAPGIRSFSRPGHIWLDERLLDAGMFSWAVIQDEYAHQLDFLLFDPALRARLTGELGARAWCRETAGFAHHEYGCERFASTLVWAYWPSSRNAYRPSSRHDESAAMPPRRFRALMADVLGVPQLA